MKVIIELNDETIPTQEGNPAKSSRRHAKISGFWIHARGLSSEGFRMSPTKV